MVSRFQRWPPRQPSWIAKLNDLSNSKSLCRSNASHQVLVQSVLEMSFEEFQDCHRGGHLGYQNGTFLSNLNLNVAPMPPIKFWPNPTQFVK